VKNVKKWSLNPKEISCGMNNSSSGKTGQFARMLKTTSSTIFLTHTPTNIMVQGEVPVGNYRKKEMPQKRTLVEQSLFKQLENLVAKKLNIKGR
jgi:protein subunit release factor A